MDSEQQYLLHFKRMEELLNTIPVELEPHPVKLETEEEVYINMRGIIARALEYHYNLRDKKNELLFGTFTYSVANTNINIAASIIDQQNSTIMIDEWIAPRVIIEPINKNREAYIHSCIYCGTKKESDGVDIYNIICDSCACDNTYINKIFLHKEDYKYETLILEGE